MGLKKGGPAAVTEKEWRRGCRGRGGHSTAHLWGQLMRKSHDIPSSLVTCVGGDMEKANACPCSAVGTGGGTAAGAKRLAGVHKAGTR